MALFGQNKVSLPAWVLGARRCVVQVLDLIGGVPFVEDHIKIKIVEGSDKWVPDVRDLVVTGFGYMDEKPIYFKCEATFSRSGLDRRAWQVNAIYDYEFTIKLSETSEEGSWQPYHVTAIEDPKKPYTRARKIRVTLGGWGVLTPEERGKHKWKWREGRDLQDLRSEPLDY